MQLDKNAPQLAAFEDMRKAIKRYLANNNYSDLVTLIAEECIESGDQLKEEGWTDDTAQWWYNRAAELQDVAEKMDEQDV